MIAIRNIRSLSLRTLLFPQDALLHDYFSTAHTRYIKLEKGESMSAAESREMSQLQGVYAGVCSLDKLLTYEEELSHVIKCDEDMRPLATTELCHTQQSIQNERDNLIRVGCDKIMNEDNSLIVEVVPGVGGSESAIFVGELLSLYRQLAEDHNLTYESLSASEARVSGERAYGLFGHEGGVHRVQRVPLTERSGRVHTSTVAVSVRPENEQLDVSITEKDVDVHTFRSSGAGGQHVNKSNTAVRVVHRNTGMVVENQEERSLAMNLKKAMSTLRHRIESIERGKQSAVTEGQRSAHLGNRERSEKIRTYNQPHNRITDHRISHSLYGYHDFFGRADKLRELVHLLNLGCPRALLHDYIRHRT